MSSLMALTVLIYVLGVIRFSQCTVLTAFATSNVPGLNTEIERATRTRTALYAPWSIPTAIPYRLSPSYTTADLAVIQAAMNEIARDMSQCIQFVPYANGTDGGKDFLQISQSLEPGSASTISTATCFSFPGRVINQTGRGQKLGLVSGPDGCLTVQRDTMKYLVHSLGLRNEYNRPDRDSFITVNLANQKPGNSIGFEKDIGHLLVVFLKALANLGLLNPFPAGTVDLLTGNFDYKSITMINPSKYAISPTTPLFTIPLVNPAQAQVPGATTTIGDQARLSQGDCLGLKAIYSASCAAATCSDPYNGAGASATSGGLINGVPIFGAVPTGTPLDPSNTVTEVFVGTGTLINGVPVPTVPGPVGPAPAPGGFVPIP